LDTLRRLTRDIYIRAGDIYFWQGAIRDPADPDRSVRAEKVSSRAQIVVDVVNGNQHRGHRVVSRFGLAPRDVGTYLVPRLRPWKVDRPDPSRSR